MSEEKLHIDLDELLHTKVPKYRRYIPGFVVRWLERIICQRELNELLDSTAGTRNEEFAEAAMSYIGATVEAHGLEKFAPDDSHRYIFASNHPLGGLDGIALIALLGRHYGGKVRCVVNDMLMQVKPLAGVFLPANKHGRQTEASVKAINDAMASDCQMLYFPAGLCSRRQPDGSIADLEWRKSFITKSIEYQRDVVPVFFSGQNSTRFYRFAQWRKRLGLKLNIEMILLPGEMMKCRGKHFEVIFGSPIPWTSFTDGKPAIEHAARVRECVYNLMKNNL